MNKVERNGKSKNLMELCVQIKELCTTRPRVVQE